jgi:GNAT superfamily N-acetyltransferase
VSTQPIPEPKRFRIEQVTTAAQVRAARDLFLEYANSLGFSLAFQNFEHELRTLPGDYAPPHGRLLLAYLDDAPVGCVALHEWKRPAEGQPEKPLAGALTDPVCEMKRLYVRPAARGHALGRILVERLIKEARAIGYKRMRLDTVEPIMTRAVLLYRDMGFQEILAYRENPMKGTLYFELKL